MMQKHSKWEDLKYRLITSFFLIPAIIVAIFFLSLACFTVAIIVVCMLSFWEWGKISGVESCKTLALITFFCGLFLALMVLSVHDSHSFIMALQVQCALWSALVWWSAALVMVLFYPSLAVIWRLSCILRLIFGILTIVPFFCGALALRQYNYDVNQFTGSWLLLYVIALVWSSDSGAYFFGRIFGHYKILPNVSPGKTWEGVVGGVTSSLAVSCFFSKYLPLDIASFKLPLYSIIIALASVLGDLTESMFKREAGIKDSGFIIPGHGGILDRIDSLTAVLPIFACLTLLVFNAI